ncbi:MAG: diaminopimelate decarboxylase [Lachnospiraceae bacterium]|nr:diaminopimelate decarboxylase [Lachnospiraceae bacterium]
MKTPFVTKEKIEEIMKEVPTPFHIYDEKGIRENARLVQKAFSWNEGYREYFAVKAEPNPVIMKILQEEGCGSDCSSLTELILAKEVGNSGDMTMFSSNETPDFEYAYANDMHAIINLDDITMIDSFAKAVGRFPKKMCCRFNPGGVFKVSNGIMDTPGESKYGMTDEQLFKAFRILKNNGVEEFGIHSFLVSNAVTNDYYPMLAKLLFELAVSLKKETGAHITFINLSGGVGIPYKPGDPANDILAIGEGVRKAYEEILVPAGMGDVAIYTEMGRFMTGPYGALVTTAIHEKNIMKHYIGVDACACNLMRPAMYGAYHHITVLGKEDAPLTNIYDVVGGLCENNDKFAIDRMLPRIDMGDILYIHDTGAHGFSMGYNYNGRLRSSEVLLHPDGTWDVIRRAEKPEDYFATLSDLSDYEGIQAEVANSEAMYAEFQKNHHEEF